MAEFGRANSKEEISEAQHKRNVWGESLVEAWSEVSEGSGLSELASVNKNTAINTAIALEMQEAHLKNLSETVISSQFQMKPENVLKVVRLGVANANRGNIFTEYNLQTVDDAFYHIDMVYEKTLRGATADNKVYESTSAYYAGEQNVYTIGDGEATSYVAVPVSPASVVPYSVNIIVGGVRVGNDDGNGNLTFTGIDTSATNTVDYATGAFTMNFVGAPGALIEVLYNWDSENEAFNDQIGTMGISLRKTRFQARAMPLGYSFTTMTELTLGTTGLGNAEDLLIGAIGDEHAKAKDYKAIAKARMVAKTNPTTTFNTDFAAAGEISDYSHAQKLMSIIKGVGMEIYDDLKRGQVNKAVAGSKALVYAMKSKQWVDDTTQPREGVFLAGRLGDIEVYACPADASMINNNEMILTFKNEQEGLDTAIVFGTLTEIAASLRYENFTNKGNLASVEDSAIINSKFVRLLVLDNLA